MSLSRGACYGTCPIYSVNFRQDGKAFWHGEAFVDREGDFESEIWEDDFRRLTELLQRFDFFSWSDRGPSGTDLPNYVLEVKSQDQQRTVEQWGGSEQLEFWTVAAVMDSISESLDWRRAQAQP